MTVDLAFTPQSHWTHILDNGVANDNFPSIITLNVPRQLYERNMYVSFRSNTGNNYTARGSILFILSGRVVAEQFWYRTGGGSGGELWFQQGIAADSIRFTQAGVSQDLLPHRFIVQCDNISFKFDAGSKASAGESPIWAFGCLSKSLW